MDLLLVFIQSKSRISFMFSFEDASIFDVISTQAIRAISPNNDLTFEEAMRSADREFWIVDLRTEFENLISMATWMEMWLPLYKKAMKSKTIMHRKNDGRFRPRVVLKGYSQRQGVVYLESYAPTASVVMFRFISWMDLIL